MNIGFYILLENNLSLQHFFLKMIDFLQISLPQIIWQICLPCCKMKSVWTICDNILHSGKCNFNKIKSGVALTQSSLMSHYIEEYFIICTLHWFLCFVVDESPACIFIVSLYIFCLNFCILLGYSCIWLIST